MPSRGADTKRPRRKGQITRRGESTWLVRITLGTDSAGKRLTSARTVHGTRQDAEAVLAVMLRKNAGASSLPPLDLRRAEQPIFQELNRFRDERDWGQFHTLKNLAAALAVEAAEVQELLLWKTDTEASAFSSTSKGQRDLSREIADVMIYAFLLAQEAGISPLQAMWEKMQENAGKYPVELSRGRATKYTELRQQKRTGKS